MKSVQIRSFFWSVFSYIRTEYGLSTYLARIRENTDRKNFRISTLFTQFQFQVELYFHTLRSFKNMYFRQLSVLRFLSRCHQKVGKVGSYVTKQNSEAATERYSLEQVFLKSRRNHWKIVVKEFTGIFQGFCWDYKLSYFIFLKFRDCYFHGAPPWGCLSEFNQNIK